VGSNNTGQYARDNQNLIKPAHRQIRWQCFLCPQSETGAGGNTVAPWVTRHINKFLCETAQKGGSGLTMHNNFVWLKVVIHFQGGHYIFAILQPLLLQFYFFLRFLMLSSVLLV